MKMTTSILVLLLVAGSAAAFTPQRTDTGYLIRWDLEEHFGDLPNIIDGRLEYFVNDAGSSDLPGDEELDIIRNAFAQWTGIFESDFAVNNLKTTRENRIGWDYTNLILFDETNATRLLQTGVISLAVMSYYSEDLNLYPLGYIADVDIVFNARDYTFVSSAAQVSEAARRVDLASIATHIIGTFAGLDYSFVNWTDDTTGSLRTATMHQSYQFNTEMRTIELDDRAGMTFLYPDEERLSQQRAQISGEISDAAGAKLFGVCGVAYRNHKPVVSAPSDPVGRYNIPDLDAGGYHVRIERNWPTYLRPWWQTADTNVAAEIWDNSVVSNGAQLVSVAVAGHAGNINFVASDGSSTDPFESDSNAFEAKPIPDDGTRQLHHFSAPGDADWVYFDAQAGASYVLATDNLGLFCDTILELYAPNGVDLIAANDDWNPAGYSLASRIEWTAPSTNVYRLVCRQAAGSSSGAGSNYDLYVIKQPGLTATPFFTWVPPPTESQTPTIGPTATIPPWLVPTYTATPTPTPLECDLNGDGSVGFTDLFIYAQGWQGSVSSTRGASGQAADLHLLEILRDWHRHLNILIGPAMRAKTASRLRSDSLISPWP